MNKLLLCIGAVGASLALFYILKNKEVQKDEIVEEDKESSSTISEEEVIEPVVSVYEAKHENSQNVGERHMQAQEYMKEAYKDIFTELDPIDDSKYDDIIDMESMASVKAADDISDELDDLLK